MLTTPPLIFQFLDCRIWHRADDSAGCRGFIGPVPPPLWMSCLRERLSFTDGLQNIDLVSFCQ